jgi:hypothetical protein
VPSRQGLSRSTSLAGDVATSNESNLHRPSGGFRRSPLRAIPLANTGNLVDFAPARSRSGRLNPPGEIIMFKELLSGFLTSDHGQNALGALQQQGIEGADAESLLNHATHAAAHSMHEQTKGHAEPAVGIFNIFGGHAGRSFLMGAVAGLMRGDGIMGAIKDGGMGMIGGHIAEVIAERSGLDPSTAATVSAAITPFILGYAHERLAEHPANAQ